MSDACIPGSLRLELDALCRISHQPPIAPPPHPTRTTSTIISCSTIFPPTFPPTFATTMLLQVILCNVRLPQYGSDLVITFNTPVFISEHSAAAEHAGELRLLLP